MKHSKKLIKSQPLIKPKPCPCCGNKKLYIGHLSAMALGVKCERYFGGCGLEICRNLMYDKIPSIISKNADFKAIDKYLTDLAIKAWNNRNG